MLASMYDEGEGVEVDKAKDWRRDLISATVREGNPELQFSLGMCFYEGEGFQREGKSFAVNKVQAFEWLQKAAKQGHKEAQYMLASMYNEGDGVEVDKVKAVEWYQKAANQGNEVAQLRLAEPY